MTIAETGPSRGVFAVLAVGCVVAAVALGFVGSLAGSTFASGPREPVLSALAWAGSAFAAALPVAATPDVGFRIRRRTATAAAAAVAVVWFVVGYVVLVG